MRVKMLLVAAVLAGALAAPRAQAEDVKDPGVAAALGGIVGLGAGYYYLEDYTKGPIFTAVDAGLIVGLVADDDNSSWWGLGLLASHVWQGWDGYQQARAHPMGMRMLPVGMQFARTGLGGISSTDINALYGLGGADRDRALAMGYARSFQPPLSFHASLEDRGIGMSYGWKF